MASANNGSKPSSQILSGEKTTGQVKGKIHFSDNIGHMLMGITEILKALADTNRLRILDLLYDRTLCVCDLEDVLELNQSNLSRHLSKLKQAGLVTAEKRALFTFYSRKSLSVPYGQVIDNLCKALHNDPMVKSDQQRLSERIKTQNLTCHSA
jgi:ArsR family transcriptional regulator